MPEARPYDTYRWKEVRKQVLRRDGYTCTYSGAPATLVNHKTPWRQGGSWYGLDNLSSACRSCNAREAYRTGGRSNEREPRARCEFHGYDCCGPHSEDW